jgi:putative transposase
MDKNVIIGFFDEASPQTTANTQRFWSFGKPIVRKNTTKYKANTFGFYALNGHSVVDFGENSKKESICIFLEKIRFGNPGKRIVVILDNFPSHKAAVVREKAKECDIELVYLPAYSPDLNPIEYIWKSIKRTISNTFIESQDHMKGLIRVKFLKYASRISFANSWIKKFLVGGHKSEMLGA